MKPLLFAVLLIASATCFGQATDGDVKRLVDKAIDNQFRFEKARASTAFPGGKSRYDPLQGFIAGKEVPSGVHALRGGMPCIVPDRTAIASIPNPFRPVVVPFRTTIPNAHPPGVAIPSK